MVEPISLITGFLAGAALGGTGGHFNGKRVERDNLNQTHQSALDARDAQCRTRLEDRDRQHQNTLEAALSVRDAQHQNTLEAALIARDAEHNIILQTQLNAHITRHTNDLNEQDIRYKNLIIVERKQHTDALNSKNIEHRNSRNNLIEQHRNELNALNLKHEQALATQGKEQATTLQGALDARDAQRETEITDLKKSHVDEIVELKKSHANQIASLKKSHDDAIALLKLKIETLEKEIKVLKQEKENLQLAKENLQQEKENALISYQNALELQRNELGSKNRELDLQRESLATQQQSLARQDARIEQLLHQLNFFMLGYPGVPAANNDSIATPSNDGSVTPSELGGSFYTESVLGESENDEFIAPSSVDSSTHDLNANNDASVNIQAIV